MPKPRSVKQRLEAVLPDDWSYYGGVWMSRRGFRAFNRASYLFGKEFLKWYVHPPTKSGVTIGEGWSPEEALRALLAEMEKKGKVFHD